MASRRWGSRYGSFDDLPKSLGREDEGDDPYGTGRLPAPRPTAAGQEMRDVLPRPPTDIGTFDVWGDRPESAVSGVIMRNRRPVTEVWTSGRDGPAPLEQREDLSGWESGRGSYLPMSAEEARELGLDEGRNETGRMPWRFERRDPVSVDEARRAGWLVDSASDHGWAPSMNLGEQTRVGNRVRQALLEARKKDDSQMTVSKAGDDPFGLDATRSVRWGRSGPTSAVNRETAEMRAGREAARRADEAADRAVKTARETPQAVAGTGGIAVWTPDGNGGGSWTMAENPRTARKGGMTPEAARAWLKDIEEARAGDKLRGREPDTERAARLEEAFTALGGTLPAKGAAGGGNAAADKRYTPDEAKALNPGTLYRGADGKLYRR